ncbi:hypothetical protein CDAR_60041 [Caerostris darwini]|uniref:Uncharacterized protein n=1 Tax=Caerostris darwini TaxID=1538125 RepID=A0AAV4QKC6_9ARAC|nr:hypothetical protein CDAR_60041 [Caerostris darwini]
MHYLNVNYLCAMRSPIILLTAIHTKSSLLSPPPTFDIMGFIMRVPLMNARESSDPVKDTSTCDAGVAKGGWVCFWMRAAVRDSGGLAKIEARIKS